MDAKYKTLFLTTISTGNSSQLKPENDFLRISLVIKLSLLQL